MTETTVDIWAYGDEKRAHQRFVASISAAADLAHELVRYGGMVQDDDGMRVYLPARLIDCVQVSTTEIP